MTQTQFNALHYVRDSITLIRENTLILWWTFVIAGCHAVSSLLQSDPLKTPMNIAIFLLSIVAAPVIYGIYYEVIRGKYSSIPAIAARYAASYIWLLLRMYLPALFIAGLPMVMFPGHAGGGYFQLILVSFSLLYLYVIPVFYLSGTQRGAISNGILFLINHLSESTPLILTVFLTEAFMLLTQHVRTILAETNPVTMAAIDFFSFILASVIDFLIFIILIHVLKGVLEK